MKSGLVIIPLPSPQLDLPRCALEMDQLQGFDGMENSCLSARLALLAVRQQFECVQCQLGLFDAAELLNDLLQFQ